MNSPEPSLIVIALGSNLVSHAGTSQRTIAAALATLESNAASPVKVSRHYSSPAWPNPNDPSYVNAVAQIKTFHSPQQLMRVLHAIEISFGRVRGAPNAPRTLDLDLIDYEGRVEAGPPALPHPRMKNRAFVLLPLADIAPHWRHPVSGETVQQLIAALPQGDRAATLPLDD